MKQLYRFIHYFGLLHGLKLFFKVKSNRLDALQLPGYKHPFRLRPQTTDLAMFYQIFFNQCYDLNFSFQPKIIIDAGANIGLASIFFAGKFPNATLIAIEPQDDNFKLLAQNLSPYNVTAIQAALWSQAAIMQVHDKGYGESGFITEPSTNKEGIVSITIHEIMQKYDLKQIDILKIDIEGSEAEVFARNYEQWLPVTKCLIIEIHDDMRPGASKAVFKAFCNYNFRLILRGENLVFLNSDLM